MIELLALAQPPAIVAQAQTIFRDDFTRGCPGFTPSQNQDIGYRASADAQVRFPQMKVGSLNIFFTMPFIDFFPDNIEDMRNNRPHAGEVARIDRLADFINGDQSVTKRYVFFCPGASDGVGESFWENAREFISRTFNMGVRQPGLEAFTDRLGLFHVDYVHRGQLYYVNPRAN